MEGRGPEPVGQAEPAASWLHLVERVAACSRLLRSALDSRMANCGLNPSQFSVLWFCYQRCAGVGQNELAELLVVSPAHVSGLVEQLRRRKLLTGHRPAADRRRQLWRLTPRGAASVAAVRAALRAWAEELDRRLPPGAAWALERLVEQLTAAVEAAGAEPHSAGQKGAA